MIRRVDLMVTTRLHGLVLALRTAAGPGGRSGRGGAKVSAQAQAWAWAAVVRAEADGTLDHALLASWRDWCLSPTGTRAATAAAQGPPVSGLTELRRFLAG